LLEAAHEALRDGLEGLLAKPEPSVSFIPGFGASSLDFSLGLQIRQFTDQFPVQSELRKRIIKKFRDAGIDMPFPARTRITDKPVKDVPSGGPKS
jgi:small-conductance mechanosensitive channel